jgi:hypothetical protein
MTVHILNFKEMLKMSERELKQEMETRNMKANALAKILHLIASAKTTEDLLYISEYMTVYRCEGLLDINDIHFISKVITKKGSFI